MVAILAQAVRKFFFGLALIRSNSGHYGSLFRHPYGCRNPFCMDISTDCESSCDSGGLHSYTDSDVDRCQICVPGTFSTTPQPTNAADPADLFFEPTCEIMGLDDETEIGGSSPFPPE